MFKQILYGGLIGLMGAYSACADTVRLYGENRHFNMVAGNTYMGDLPPGRVNAKMKESVELNGVPADLLGDYTTMTGSINWADNCTLKRVQVTDVSLVANMNVGQSLEDCIIVASDPSHTGIITMSSDATIRNCMIVGYDHGIIVNDYSGEESDIRYNLISDVRIGMEIYKGLGMKKANNIFIRNTINARVFDPLPTKAFTPFTLEDQFWYDVDGNRLLTEAEILATIQQMYKAGGDVDVVPFHTVDVLVYDLDGDTIPDLDEGFYDVDLDGLMNNEDTESDGDGFDDHTEVLEGTDPYDPLSFPSPSVPLNPLGLIVAVPIAYLLRKE